MSTSYAKFSRNDVFFLGSDPDLRKELNTLLGQTGLTLRYFQTLEDMRPALRLGTPAVFILSTDRLPEGEGLVDVVSRLFGDAGDAQRPALICLAEREDFDQRLQSVRAGAKGFFLKPFTAEDVAAKVTEIASPSTDGYRILVVEDDPAQANYIALILKNEGMEARTLIDPLKLFGTLSSFRPNLIVMDLHMPGASGIELTAVIRDHDDYFDIPIIFLSAETDEAQERAALNVGADSFIHKPVTRTNLLAAIQQRILLATRAQRHRSALSQRSTPSGLLHRDFFLQLLDRSIHEGNTSAGGTALLLIELDGAEEMLEWIGLGASERLISRVERTISRQLGPDEVGARVGDFAFAMLARRASTQKLQDLADQVRGLISDLRIKLEEGSYSTTASVGIAAFEPAPDDALAMVSRAEKAKDQARAAGGDRVDQWSPKLLRDHLDESEARVASLIRQALTSDGFLLLFQPIAALSDTDETARYEAQLRLRAFDGEMIPPRELLPIARRAGLLERVDRWVVERALDVLAEERYRQLNLRVLVHQCMETVAAKGWVMWFREQIVKRNLVDQLPLLQFQLADLKANLTAARALFTVLRKNGIDICIANLSSSAAELALVKQLSAAMVRLSFDTSANTEAQELKYLIHSIHGQGAQVIAGGIESPETIARVWGAGADMIQGNYLQMPSEALSFNFTGGKLG